MYFIYVRKQKKEKGVLKAHAKTLMESALNLTIF